MLECSTIGASDAEHPITEITSALGLELLVSGPQIKDASIPAPSPLVSIHGVARNHREHARAFADLCGQLGIPLIVPRFPSKRFKGYQRLERSADGLAPDETLLAALDECCQSFGWTPSFRLFGFSGGAQFAHRFVLLHARRDGDTDAGTGGAHVERLALASAGFYTMPDATVPYPEGLGGQEPSERMDFARLLSVPTRIFVGERDIERDRDLRVSGRLDRQQGRNRFERAQRFVFAMRSAAAVRRVAPPGTSEPRSELATPEPCNLEILRGCGHSFRRCVRTGGLDRRVLGFLYPELRSLIESRKSSVLAHDSSHEGARS